MKFGSEEIRTKAVQAYLAGKATPKQLADIFGYTPATVYNWVRTYRLHNRLRALPNGHRRSCFTQEELAELSKLIEKHVDITLEEIRRHFKKTCSLSAIHRIVVKLGFVYKKNAQGERARAQRHKKGT